MKTQTQSGNPALEKNLAVDILMMFADTFESLDLGGDVLPVMQSAYLTAQGIAKKLVAALTQQQDALDAQSWQQIVNDAASGAFMELPDGSLVQLGDNASFKAAIADRTVLTVAPAGSDLAARLRSLENQSREVESQSTV